jgi:hypothetical protein
MIINAFPQIKKAIFPPPRKESIFAASLRERIQTSHRELMEDDPRLLHKRVVIVIIYVMVLLFQQKRYYWWYPTIPAYPDNRAEVEVVIKDYVLKRMPSDVEFFHMTDANPAVAFQRIIKPEEMDLEDMTRILLNTRLYVILRGAKYFYNRARPAQISPEHINPENGTLIETPTAETPAYPSGHAAQTYYLAHVLSRKFPSKTQALFEMAEKCAVVRVQAGLHYPSDIVFARKLVDQFMI